MKRNQRTSEEKQFDRMLKAGIGRLGPKPADDAPNAFRHILVWDRFGRRGQRCRILKNTDALCTVEFEDGYRTPINRMALRRG